MSCASSSEFLDDFKHNPAFVEESVSLEPCAEGPPRAAVSNLLLGQKAAAGNRSTHVPIDYGASYVRPAAQTDRTE